MEYLLRLVGSAVNGKAPPAPPKGIDFHAFCRIAEENAFTQVVYPGVEAFRKENCFPAAALDALKRDTSLRLHRT